MDLCRRPPCAGCSCWSQAWAWFDYSRYVPRVQLHQLQQQKRFAQMDDGGDDGINYYVPQL